MPSDPNLLLVQGIPAVPGGLWSLLAKLAWSDPDLVRFYAIPFLADVQGGAGPVEADAKVVAKQYFIVRQIRGHVEQDFGVTPALGPPPTAWEEFYSAQDVSFQIEDRERNLDYFDASIRMSDLVGVGGINTVAGVGSGTVPTPIDCDEFPMVFLPGANILVTFTPNAEFPSSAHSITTATTRKVGITMYGALVNETLVDRLLDMNAEALMGAGLLTARRKR